MSKNRYPKLKKDENGKIICRGCGGKIPKGRFTWCSSACYEKHEPGSVYRFVVKRAGGKCEQCGMPVMSPEGHQHHIIPFKSGGLTIQENLLLLCIPCHKIKHQKRRAVLNAKI